MDESAIKEGMVEGIQALLFREGALAECVVLTSDHNGSYLKSMQRYVKGPIEHEHALEIDGGPTLVVNEEGVLENMALNGAVFASRKMEEEGFASRIDGKPVKEGEGYCVLYGPILAVGYDEDLQLRDITVAEACIACRRIARPKEDADPDLPMPLLLALHLTAELIGELVEAGDSAQGKKGAETA